MCRDISTLQNHGKLMYKFSGKKLERGTHSFKINECEVFVGLVHMCMQSHLKVQTPKFLVSILYIQSNSTLSPSR